MPEFSKWFSSPRFPHQNPTCPSPLFHTCRMPVHHILLDLINQIFGQENRSLSSSLCSFRPPRPKYSPEHPILQHPQPTFLLQYDRPSFTPKQNDRKNYSAVNLNLEIFG
jgi:hypothetical protein